MENPLAFFNQKQMKAITQLQKALDACRKAKIEFANTYDNILTPFPVGYVATTHDSLRFHSQSDKVTIEGVDLPIENILYIEHGYKSPASESKRFEQYSFYCININGLISSISDDGLVILKK